MSRYYMDDEDRAEWAELRKSYAAVPPSETGGTYWKVRLASGKLSRWLYQSEDACQYEIDRLTDRLWLLRARAKYRKERGIKARPRDMRRKAAYRAENIARSRSSDAFASFDNLEQVRDYVNERLAAAGKLALPGLQLRHVRTARLGGVSGYGGWSGGITLIGAAAKVKWLILHELAHVLVTETDAPGHSVAWAAMYCELVESDPALLHFGRALRTEMTKVFGELPKQPAVVPMTRTGGY